MYAKGISRSQYYEESAKKFNLVFRTLALPFNFFGFRFLRNCEPDIRPKKIDDTYFSIYLKECF